MKKSLCVIAMTGLFVLPLSLTSCASVETAAPSVVPMPVGADRVNPKWLHFNCAMSDINFEQVKLCIQTQAALLPPLDKNKREYFGESYDPVKYLKCRMEDLEKSYVSNTACNRLRLHRVEDPEYWPNPDVPKPKWPDAPNPPVYREGMTSEEYFKALCEKEAGEFIYKIVENVEGVYQIRPFHEARDEELSDKYVLEDPYSYTRDSVLAPWDVYVQPYIGRFTFFEVTTISVHDNYFAKTTNKQINFQKIDTQYVRFFRDSSAHPGKTISSGKNGSWHQVPYIVSAEPTNTLNSRYGYTWHGIERTQARARGIAGGEQIIVDLKTGEVLALRRSFMFSNIGNRTSSPSAWWMGARHCSKELTAPTDAFIRRVLKPINAQ